MDDMIIRLAQPQDKAAVLAFCAHTWEWGDYIADMWDDWLADASGRLLVAILDNRPVGLLHLRMVGPDECWLQGMRVDPAMRKQGISTRLCTQAMRESRQMGATVARLAIHSDNAAAQRVIASLGFQQVATYLHYDAPAEEVRGAPPLSVAAPSDLPALLAFLERSNLFPLTGGLIYEDWGDRAHELTEEALRERLEHGQVFMLRQWDDFQAIAICGRHDAAEPVFLVEYIDGTMEGIGRLAYGLRPLAAERGLEQVSITVPNLLLLRDVLEGIGYQTEDAGFFLVYQRPLDAAA
jgi:GNAT superfamily N-acetyltransferase